MADLRNMSLVIILSRLAIPNSDFTRSQSSLADLQNRNTVSLYPVYSPNGGTSDLGFDGSPSILIVNLHTVHQRLPSFVGTATQKPPKAIRLRPEPNGRPCSVGPHSYCPNGTPPSPMSRRRSQWHENVPQCAFALHHLAVTRSRLSRLQFGLPYRGA